MSALLCRRIFERLGNSQRRHPSFFRPKSRHARTIRHNSMTSIWTRSVVQTRRPLHLAGTRCHRNHQMSPSGEGSMVPNCRTSSKKAPDAPNEEGSTLPNINTSSKKPHLIQNTASSTLPNSHTSCRTLKVQRARGRTSFGGSHRPGDTTGTCSLLNVIIRCRGSLSNA
jgi:hypothetical protein